MQFEELSYKVNINFNIIVFTNQPGFKILT